MAWGPSAIYEVKHLNGWRIAEMRINNTVMDKADVVGLENYQKKVSMAFRDLVRKNYSRDPGWIDFDCLVFTKLRDIP